jgi:hypothetical protein
LRSHHFHETFSPTSIGSPSKGLVVLRHDGSGNYAEAYLSWTSVYDDNNEWSPKSDALGFMWSPDPVVGMIGRVRKSKRFEPLKFQQTDSQAI